MFEGSVESMKRELEKHNQGHILAFWDELSADQKEALATQIGELDLKKIDEWVVNYVKNTVSHPLPHNFEPAPYYSITPKNAQEAEKHKKAVKLGTELLAGGKVAGFVVAGGQGTRLGFDGPKGNFPASPIKKKTLFAIFGETIAAVSKKYGAACPWYIMTSPLNDAETRRIFHSNNYYGLDEKNVFIFQQGTLPNFGFDGRILMADKANIACSPDGHGGSGALQKRGG